mmetsp:Transcript_14013/g.16972  ORF Transcript_14013/g.16972 Transcript_14013/m.16972 type:complete len:150 (+) Transcript_14013:481-930(+)
MSPSVIEMLKTSPAGIRALKTSPAGIQMLKMSPAGIQTLKMPPAGIQTLSRDMNCCQLSFKPFFAAQALTLKQCSQSVDTCNLVTYGNSEAPSRLTDVELIVRNHLQLASYLLFHTRLHYDVVQQLGVFVLVPMKHACPSLTLYSSCQA